MSQESIDNKSETSEITASSENLLDNFLRSKNITRSAKTKWIDIANELLEINQKQQLEINGLKKRLQTLSEDEEVIKQSTVYITLVEDYEKVCKERTEAQLQINACQMELEQVKMNNNNLADKLELEEKTVVQAQNQIKDDAENIQKLKYEIQVLKQNSDIAYESKVRCEDEKAQLRQEIWRWRTLHRQLEQELEDKSRRIEKLEKEGEELHSILRN